MKKILSLLLAITLIFGVLPMSAFAGEPNAEPKTDIIDIIDDTVDDPVEDQTDPVEDPTEDQTDDPTDNPTNTINATNGGGMILVDSGDGCTCNAFCDDPDCIVCKDDHTQCFYYICICEAVCAEGEANPACPVCKDDYSKCAQAVTAPQIAPMTTSSSVDSVDKLNIAIGAFNIEDNNDDYTIEISGNFDTNSTAIEVINNTTNPAKKLIIKSTGGMFTITRKLSGNLFRVISGELVLENVTLDGAKTSYPSAGSLVEVESGAVLTMNNGATLQNNSTGGSGSGVTVSGTFNMIGGTITGNKALFHGGGVFVNGGVFTMDGGIISDNEVGQNGGGVYIGGGTFTMNDGTIDDNKADGYGGGVEVGSGTFDMGGGTISTNEANGGGGVSSFGTFNMSGTALIENNMSNTTGGGVFSFGTFTMDDGTISDNRAPAGGGGVNVEDGTFTMNNGTISGNYVYTSFGGGVLNKGTYNMTGGTISTNEAGTGGGVAQINNTFTMSGDASIDDNTAATNGGGVFFNNGTFNMSGTSSITGNTAGNNGGGVWASRSAASFTVKDSAQITCGVYLDGGTSGGSRKITLAGTLNPIASIGIEGMGVTDPGTIVATNATASDMAKFFISNAAGKIGDNNGFVLSGSDIVLGTAAPPAPPTPTPSSGGGSSKKEKPAPAPSPWLDPTPAQKMSNDAKHKDSDLVRTKSSDLYGVRKDAWQKLKGYRFVHDTMDGDTVGVRVSINEPEKIKQDLLVSGYVKGASANSRKAQFEKWFNNKIHVIHFDQNGAWGQPVEIAAKIDPNQFDSLNNLFLYSYDSTTGKYTRIERQSNHWLDNKGYLHFTTELAGDIIISEGPLEKK